MKFKRIRQTTPQSKIVYRTRCIYEMFDMQNLNLGLVKSVGAAAINKFRQISCMTHHTLCVNQ